MIVRTAEDVGLLIRERRRALGLDQQTLAKKMNVSRLWIIEIERGKPRAEIGLVLRALLALGLQLDVSPATGAPRPGARSSDVPAPDLDAIVRAARRRR